MADDQIQWENLSSLMSGGSQQSSPVTQLSDLDAMTQKNLANLQPDFADRAAQWIQGMRDAGYNPVLNYGYRTPQEQQVLYQKHLAGGPQAVPPQMSYHTYGRAFDWVNKDEKGNLQWNNDSAYAFGQKLATQYGLTGIGRGDNDHIQDAKYKSWKDLPREEFGTVRPRQQQVANANVAQPSGQGSTAGGVTFENLNSLLSR